MQILLIGYGNPLREDDGVGWAAAAALREAFASESATLVVEMQHQLLPELAEPISRADLVIFVDATVEGEPGTIRQTAVQPGGEQPGAFSHHVGPAGLLEMARTLYGRFPPATLFTVTAARLGYGEALSAPVSAALPALLQQIQARLDQGVQST